MSSTKAAEKSLPLDLQIDSVEQEILERRQRIGPVATLLGRNIRVRMVTPAVLTAAVAFGVYLQRRRPGDRNSSLLKLVNSVYATGSVVMTLAAWISPAPVADAGSDSDPPSDERVA